MNRTKGLAALLTGKQNIVHQCHIDNETVYVKETQTYRWFEYGDDSIQSLMHKIYHSKVISPIAESFLLFLLMDQAHIAACTHSIDNDKHNKHINVLNLGLGGASIERALAQCSTFQITSVDASQTIIDIARQYFHLPNQVSVICQQAEQFIAQTSAIYDVILCDVFISSKSPSFVFTKRFYQQLHQISSNKVQVIINCKADSAKQLLALLLNIKQYFPYIVLIEFDDYANIIIVCSNVEIPNKAQLHSNLSTISNHTELSSLSNTNLAKAIENMRYIPHVKTTNSNE